MTGPQKSLPVKRPRSAEERQAWASLGLIIFVVLLGTFGYMMFEGWDWFDSLYMTIITLATIGYQEVHPMSPPGKAFTIVLVIIGVGTVSYVLSTLARNFIERNIGFRFEERRMKEKISKLSGHTVFGGYGRLSQIALDELRGSGERIVVVEMDASKVEQAVSLGLLAIQGDITQEEILVEAGVERAQRLVTLLPKDSDNLYVILTARELNPNITVISRAEDFAGEKRLKRAGADKVIAPYREGGHKIARGILRPSVADFIDIATGSGAQLQVEQIRIPDLSPYAGQSLQSAGLRHKANVIVAAIIDREGQMVFNPSGETLLQAGSTLIGLGRKQDIQEFEKLLVGS